MRNRQELQRTADSYATEIAKGTQMIYDALQNGRPDLAAEMNDNLSDIRAGLSIVNGQLDRRS